MINKYTILLFNILITLASITTSHAASATLNWTPNTESDLAGYNIYFGTASRTYGPPINATAALGSATPTHTLADISTPCGDHRVIFFAVTAFDIAGNESDFSNEVTKTYDVAPCSPTLAEIIAALETLLKTAKIETVITFPNPGK